MNSLKLSLCCLVLALACVFNPPAFAKEKPTITWLIWELSPEFIRHGNHKGKGFADKYLQYFITHLPEYEHKILWTNIQRFHRVALLSQRCTPHIWGTFYRDQLAYSKPYMLTPPHVAIFHKRAEKELGPSGTMHRLTDLFEKHKMTMMTPTVYMDQPRYPVLSPYLKPYMGTPQVIEMSHGSNEVDLRLIERGRADFGLGYPTTISAQKLDRGIGDNFISYPLEEEQTYNEIHVSCYGDAFGKEVLAKINKLMNRETLMDFLDLYEEWNNKEPRFRKAFMKQIVQPNEAENNER